MFDISEHMIITKEKADECLFRTISGASK